MRSTPPAPSAPPQPQPPGPIDSIDQLKAHARVLQRCAQAADAVALRRLRRLPDLKQRSDVEISTDVKRRQCLTVVARELGFCGWDHALAVLTSQETEDFGTLLYPNSCVGHWNIWSASYDEAHHIRAAHGGYLLAYKRQFLIVEAGFIDTIGLDPNDADWERMQRDWVRPSDTHARERQYSVLVRNALAALDLPRT
jgi:hypothetical protein